MVFNLFIGYFTADVRQVFIFNPGTILESFVKEVQNLLIQMINQKVTKFDIINKILNFLLNIFVNQIKN